MIGGGFYPREIFLSPNNNKIFFVKLQTSIVAMTVFNYKTPKIVSVNSFSGVSPTEKWAIVFGKRTYVVVTPQSFTEYFNSGSGKAVTLQTISTKSFSVPFAYSYDAKTDIIYVRGNDNSNLYIKLSQGVIDTQYYKITSNIEKFSVSGNWMIIPDGANAYNVLSEPTLNVKATIPDS